LSSGTKTMAGYQDNDRKQPRFYNGFNFQAWDILMQNLTVDESMSEFHIPVMPNEISQFAEIKGKYIDLTVGSGGHSKIILEANEENRLLGIDCSKDSLMIADKD